MDKLNRGASVKQQMGNSPSIIHINLHAQHKRIHHNILPSMVELGASNHKHGTNCVCIQAFTKNLGYLKKCIQG